MSDTVGHAAPARVSRPGAMAAAIVPSLALGPAFAFAADMNAVNHASGAVIGSAVPSLGVGAVLQTLFGLMAVIGLVFGCAWLARRFGLQPARRGGALQVVASVAVGGKERATVVEIGDTWLVLGVAPGNVRLLHTLPAGSPGAITNMTNPTSTTDTTRAAGTDDGGAAALGHGALPGGFGERLRGALAGEVAKRLGGHRRKDARR